MNESRKRIGSISLIVILIACSIAVVGYVMANGSNPIGPPAPSPSGGPTPTPQPTATPQGLTSVLSVDNTTSGQDINMSLTGDQLRFQRTNTAEFDARAQSVGIGTLFIPDLASTTDDVVAEDLTQTLTNKTIDGDDNTFVDLKPDQFDNLDSPADEECATYESNQIEWQPCGSGGSRFTGFDRRDTGSGQRHIAGCLTDCRAAVATGAGNYEDKIFLVPFFVGEDTTLTSFIVNVTNAGSGGELAEIAIWDSNDPPSPNSLVYDGGTFAVDSTGVKTISGGSTALTANTLYWVGISTDSATVQFSSLDRDDVWTIPLGLSSASLTIVYTGRVINNVCCGSLPDPVGSTNGNTLVGIWTALVLG